MMIEACCSRFTAAEGGARLAAAAATKNILAVEYANFIPVRLLYEKAYQIRGSLYEGSKRSVYVTRASRVQVVAFELKILTDLGTVAAQAFEDVYDWTAELENNEVLICTSSVLKQILEEEQLLMSSINVLIVDSCHLIYSDDNLKYIMRTYKQCPQSDQPIILALTYPLFTNPKKDIERDTSTTEKDPGRDEELGVYENADDFNMYEKLEWKIEELEGELCCEMDLAEDIDGGKRISSSLTKPKELIIEYRAQPTDDELPEAYKDLEKYMKETVQDALDFIEDHRHDPTEIYGEELYDEFMNIPDPTLDPKQMFKQFLYVLEQLGPYAADKAAFSLLTKLEKLKIKVPYERHFILMCLCTTVFIKIRCYAEILFNKYEDEWERIKTFSTPKIMRFAEILEKFKPPDISNQNTSFSRLDSATSIPDTCDTKEDSGDNETGSVVSGCDSLSRGDSTKKMLIDIDECDFKSLGNRIEDKVNTYCSNLREIVDSPTENFDNINVNDKDSPNIPSQTDISCSTIKISSSKDTSNSNIPPNTSITDVVATEVRTNTDIVGNELDTPPDTRSSRPDSRSTEVSGTDTRVCGMDIKGNEVMVQQRGMLGFTRRTGNRLRGRTRLQRNNAARVLQMQQNPDALCGIVFMKEALIAKIMFMMIVDMSRCNRRLGYLCVQYCATENPADPGTEPRECQRQGKKQEEVLKKFRMHECNLLLATSALEEGIDLPRCNLVLRWDVPASYRSYGLCRGRARAARASAALLCSNDVVTTNMLLHNVATYRELDQIISRKCGCGIQDEPPQSEEDHADTFTNLIKPYTPNDSPTIHNTRHNIKAEESGQTSINDDGNGKVRIDGEANEILTDSVDYQNIKAEESGKTSSDDDGNGKRGNSDTENVKIRIDSKDNVKLTDAVDLDEDLGNLKLDNCKPNEIINDIDHNKSLENYKGINQNILEEIVGDNANICKGDVSDNDFRNIILDTNKFNNNPKVCIENIKVNETIDNKNANLTKRQNNSTEDVIDNAQAGDVMNTVNKENNDFVHEIVEQTANINIENNNRQESMAQIGKKYDNDAKIEQNDVKSEHNRIEQSKKLETYIPMNRSFSADDILSKANCNKCYNVKVNHVCLCSNVNLYYQLLAKSSVSVCENKKIISDSDTGSVDLSSAIALINRYCGKLPSDTFTRLAPQWWMEEVQLPVPGSGETKTAYICTLRLPLNCPVKYNIVGHPMPTKVLARRMVALQACRILHKSGELDNQLMPIGKENFKAVELEACNTVVAFNGAAEPHDCARPGTTKRRQYYYKRTAWAFTDCQPLIDTSDKEINPDADPETLDIDSDFEVSNETEQETTKHKDIKPKDNAGKKRNMLYAIVSKLWCALPERYNTRGRRLHAPQNASQAIGILMARDVSDNLQIPAFPVYTRSGEVRVSVEHVPDADVRMSPRRGRLVRRFMRFVFAEVLRVRRRGMKLQSDGSTHNNYYIVPTVKVHQEDGTHKIDIDWAFLELIYDHTEDKKQNDIEKPLLWQDTEEEQKTEKDSNRKKRGRKKMLNPLLKKGDDFVFDAERYKEAVVTPWYRNQDQPQFFLVAEICWNLSPDSSFPSATHQSFRDYYSTKYGVTLTQREQPLLDVDHTSARLNLLTPRYVNRKGVALPVSSERTRRAKRDRLDQKQILIPELCRVHPFAAPLWFATVALPCVLYRINALLIADEIRRAVAIDVGLGIPKISEETMPGFQWPALDFGWSLAEVLSADSEKSEMKKDDDSKIEKTRENDAEKDNVEKKETEEGEQKEVPKKTINDILQEKEDAEAEAAFEIGTWSNDMASSIPESSEYDDLMEPLPPNLTFCTSASGGTNWCDPISKPKFSQFNPSKNFSMADSDDSYMSSDLDSDDTDLDFDGSDEDTDTSGFCNSKNANAAVGVRIEYKTAHEAEAFDLERTKKVNPAPMPDEVDDLKDKVEHERVIREGSAPEQHIEKFRAAVSFHKKEFINKGQLITQTDHITEVLPEVKDSFSTATIHQRNQNEALKDLFPFGTEDLTFKNGQIDLESIERNKRSILNNIRKSLPKNEIDKLNCFSMTDINIDSPDYVNEKVFNVGFDTKEGYEEVCRNGQEFKPYYVDGSCVKDFDFDYQPTLEGHPGPSPSVILQALTMSNANDGINLERLETIGDSFLKFAITAYLYCAHPTVHEGKLSHMRSKQVSNLNLYRLGRNKRLGARMIASKFEPHDNWLPPCHKPPPTLHPRINGEGKDIMQHLDTPLDSAGCFIPYNLITQHSIPDKSIADCVEALIGAYLLECGPRGALLFMSWLGIRVLPCHHVSLPDNHPYVSRMEKAEKDNQECSSSTTPERKRSTSTSSSCSDEDSSPQEVFPEDDWSWPGRAVGSLQPYKDPQGKWMQPIFGELKAPPSPLLRYIEDPEGELEQMLSGYDALERTLQYRFKDRSLLLQALTHASHHSNRLTDCYQRLEFLGDAILDYLITRHLYEDPRRHSPGALTDLRSALVNNTIFATLAARHGFHKYFRHMSPGLNEVLTKYVKIQEENGHSISEEHYLIQEDEMEQAEDVEVPKALGDLFESVAGAIFLDSGMSLGAVWKSYVNLMGAELEAFSAAAPKSPVRELLEAEPDTAKFGKPERLADGRRVRVCVEVFGRGTFKGVGRNYRIAKGTAARCALRHLKVHRVR